jgi:cell division ATPase FtsA
MSSVFEADSDLGEFDKLLDCYVSAKQNLKLNPPLDCFVYPEVGAEVASVTMSRSAKKGLYAFVDIGAGTVDASVFRFHRDAREGGSQFTYAAQVLKSGAAHVESEASSNLAAESKSWFKRMKEGNIVVELSEPAEDTLKQFLAKALDEVRGEVTRDLILLFKEAYEKENMAGRWKDIQLVLGGGGALLPAYVRAAREAFSLKNGPVGANITSVSLPAPKDFYAEGLSTAVFDRFAVAYGLSFRHINLPRLVLASEVKALAPLPTKGRIDPDDR